MIHLGDITKISGYTAPVVDCIIGGSPCQDLSVAGKRAGLEGQRSGLFMQQIRIIKEMRENERRNGRAAEYVRPRYMVWENVPGAFSSNKGEDFRIVIEETAKVADENASIPRPENGKWSTSGCILADGWSIAWRVFDAQFWGVPQRRRRIALVADFGGQSAPEILFEREGMSGYSEQSGTERERDSCDTKRGIALYDCGRKGFSWDGGQVCPTLTAKNAGGQQRMPDKDNFNCVIQPVVSYSIENHPNDSRVKFSEDNNVQTLSGRMGTGGGNVPLILQAYRKTSHPKTEDEPQGWEEADVADTLNVFDNTEARTPHCVVAMDRAAYNQGKNAKFDIGISEDGVAHTVIAKGPGAVAYAVDCRNASVDTDINGTLQAKESGGTSYNLNNVVITTHPTYIVRRLTPLECERLQGYPDGWTDIGEYTNSNGKKRNSSDASRYKALGNSIALPSWKWLLKRICGCYERDATMASLFDGIGGFPYIWEQINGKGSCLWASEIEEFPIAVTKERIG